MLICRLYRNADEEEFTLGSRSSQVSSFVITGSFPLACSIRDTIHIQSSHFKFISSVSVKACCCSMFKSWHKSNETELNWIISILFRYLISPWSSKCLVSVQFNKKSNPRSLLCFFSIVLGLLCSALIMNGIVNELIPSVQMNYLYTKPSCKWTERTGFTPIRTWWAEYKV